MMTWRDTLPTVRGKLLRDEPLGPYTWFRVGGNADVLFIPADADDLADFLKALDPASLCRFWAWAPTSSSVTGASRGWSCVWPAARSAA